MQRVGGTGLQAGRLMGLLGGYPLINDLAALIDDLDGRAFQFLAVCDIGLLHAYGCFVLVDEFRDLFAAVILDGSRQDAFIKIDHGHDSLLLGLVIDVTLLVLDDLPDGVVIGAGLLIADGREYDVPVRVIVNGVHRNAGLVVDQFEDELLVLQRPVLQRLEGLQGSRSRRLVSVGEYSGSAVINRGGCHRTVAVIHDCHCDTLLSRIKCIAVLSLNDFLNGIGVSALLRVLDRVEGDLSAVAILLRLFELAALIEFEAELFGLQDPAGLTGQFLQGFKDYRALCFVGVGNGQAILTIILDLCVQFVGAVLFRNSHNDLMRCRIIGNAACSTVLLSNRVLVSTGLLEGNIAEACLRGLLSCFCSGLTRHRCAFRHCCKFKGKALCLAPFINFLGRLQLCAGGSIGIGDGQAASSVILDRCAQLVTLALFYSHDYAVRRCVIGNTVRAAVHLGDRVLVGSCLLIFDLAEACLCRILGGCCRIGYRHRSIRAHCRELEGKAVCLAPVVELLGRFDRRLGGRVGIGDDQALFAVVCHSRGQLVVVSLDYGHNCLMGLGIVGYTVCSVILLGDRILVGSGLVICDAAEYCCRSILRCYGLVLFRHRGILGHCCQIKGKAVCLAPVRKVLGGLQGHRRGSKGIGDDQLVFIVILDFCAQLVGAFLLGDGHDCLV